MTENITMSHGTVVNSTSVAASTSASAFASSSIVDDCGATVPKDNLSQLLRQMKRGT